MTQKRPGRLRLRQTLRVIGNGLISVGMLLLLFVAYQLWGTGLTTARAQDRLDDDLRQAIADTAAPRAASPPEGVPGPAAAPPPAPAPALQSEDLPATGQAAGRIEIQAIGLDWVFVRGVSVADLKKGPGHYPETPLPGQNGNAAIAGHRTTYGAPFSRIDEIEPGDEIIVTTVQGRFRYEMIEQRIVNPSQTDVLDPVEGRNLLTLTSCHPKYSARQRIIVRAELAGEPLPAVVAAPVLGPEARPGGPSLEPPSLSGDTVARWPAATWGAAAGAIWLVAAVAGRRWRRWPSYALGAGPFLVTLFLFFEQVSRLLPANY